MSIFLIRHGETRGNAERVVQHPETPLSERGLEQARLLGERMAHEGVARILTSDYARAAQTAAAVEAATRAPLHVHPSLRERNYGELRGRPYTEVGDFILMEGYEPPGGESWETFHARVDGSWEEVTKALADTSGHVAVVTHGLVLYSLVSRLLARDPDAEPPMRYGNTAVTVVESAPPWLVRTLACTGHLEGALADDLSGPSGI